MTNKPIRGDGEAKNGHMASFADFQKIDIRMGTVVDVQAFPEAHKPAWKLWVNFGADVGVKKSSAQITVHYDRDALLGRQVMAVVNFPPRQIGPFSRKYWCWALPMNRGISAWPVPMLCCPMAHG